MNDEPAPLISWYDDDEEDDGPTSTTGLYGYGLLALSAAIFAVSMNTLLELWRFAVPQSFTRTQFVMETIDSYVMRGWSIYVVVWWWTIASWLGMKLFRHSKGVDH